MIFVHDGVSYKFDLNVISVWLIVHFNVQFEGMLFFVIFLIRNTNVKVIEILYIFLGFHYRRYEIPILHPSLIGNFKVCFWFKIKQRVRD